MTASEEGPVAKLTEAFTSEQLAAAYLRLYHAQHSAPEELSPPDAKPAKTPRKEFGPSVWFSIAGGRKAEAEPRRLLPMLCKAGDLTKDDIGAIRVQYDESYVEIRESAVDGFLAALGDEMTVEGKSTVTRLDKAPEIADRPAPRGKPGPRKSHRGKDFGDAPKPHRKGYASDDKPRKPRHTKGNENPSAPIDWNDDPAPRQKKPKGGAKKPHHKPAPKATDGAVSEIKPKRSADTKSRPGGNAKPGSKPAGKPGEKRGEKPKGKGPKPPVGKPSSKKNKARRAAAALAKKTSKGGDAKPRRKK